MKKIYLFALITIISYFPLFLHLDTLPFMIWDESRLAVSAREMLQSGNYWVVTYLNTPDTWSVKPPLNIWAIALSFKLLGVNELALRLPSALFGLFTVWLIFFFCLRQFKSEMVAFFAALVLITTKGYIDYHVTRTGDYDAMLIFFETAFFLFFIEYLLEKNTRTRQRFIYLSAFSLSCAIMTKGIAGLFFLPALFIFTIMDKQFFTLLKKKHFYYAALICLTPLLIYFPYREHLAKGYFEALWKMELFNRYTEGDGDNSRLTMTFLEKIEYYYGKMIDSEFSPWFYIIPFGVLSTQVLDKNAKKIALILLLNAFIFLTIITFSNSKKEWYEAPIYPCLAILVGLGISGIYDNFKNINLKSIKRFPVFMGALFTILLFIFPFYRIIDKIYVFEDTLFDWQKRQYRPFMLRIQDNKYDIIQTDYNPPIDITKHELNNKQKNIGNIAIFDIDYPKMNYQKGDKLMACEKQAKDSLEAKYNYKLLQTYRECIFVEVVDLKVK